MRSVSNNNMVILVLISNTITGNVYIWMLITPVPLPFMNGSEEGFNTITIVPIPHLQLSYPFRDVNVMPWLATRWLLDLSPIDMTSSELFREKQRPLLIWLSRCSSRRTTSDRITSCNGMLARVHGYIQRRGAYSSYWGQQKSTPTWRCTSIL